MLQPKQTTELTDRGGNSLGEIPLSGRSIGSHPTTLYREKRLQNHKTHLIELELIIQGTKKLLVSAGKAKSAVHRWTSSHGTSSILVRYLRACRTASIRRSVLISSTNSCWRRRNSRVDLIFLSLLLWSCIHARAAWVCCWARVSSTLRATKKMSKFVRSANSGFCSTIFWAVCHKSIEVICQFNA